MSNDRKSAGVAYLLLIFLGGFGAHRFYLGRSGTAATMLALWIVGLLLLSVAVGAILLVIVAIWWFVDLFLIPGMVQQDMDSKRMRHMTEVAVLAGER